MSVSLINCPQCQTLLLGDTVQCPKCHHVLDADRAAPMVDEDAADSLVEPPGEHDPCPGCGEMVRRGLVRCWNCGTFMRGEIAESYQRLKSSPSPVILSPVPEGEAGGDAAAKNPSLDFDDTDDGTFDDDFELSPEIVAADEEDFEDNFDAQPEMTNAVFDEVDQAYSLMTQQEEARLHALEREQEELKRREEEKAAEAEAVKAEVRAALFDTAGDEAHSTATGGDVLLKVALEEEAEVGRKRIETGSRRGEGGVSTAGIVVYCPNGHRVEVQERHRGKTGRCPRCRELFFVPAGTWHEESAEPIKKTAEPEEVQSTDESAPSYKVTAGEYSYWMRDVHFHSVDVSKLKLKPGSLEAAFEPVDLAFAPFGMLKITLLKKKSGLFASGKKQDPEKTRDAVIEHLSDERPLDELPAGEHKLIDAEEMRKVRIVQPAPTEYESMFAGIPVFGKGRIAVRFPKAEGETEQKFASFPISEFRIFAEAMGDVYDLKDFGEDCEAPLANVHTELKCHFSGDPVKSLEQREYYEADDAYELKLSGRKCAECGLVISEDSRKKEKIGGANGKSIAKHKCPKCGKKFGDISLWAIEKGPGIGAEREEAARES